MRHVPLAAFAVCLVTLGVGAGDALATPFDPAMIPDQVGVVGHLDVDALRRTQIFAAVGGQAALDAALGDSPPAIKPLVRSLSRTVRGVSFWHDADHGAVYVQTSDSHSLGQLIAKLPAKPAPPVDGFPAYTIGNGDHNGFAALYGDTLLLSDSVDGLERSIRTLAGKAANLAGSNKLPVQARQGVFVFVTINDSMLGAIQKSARSKLLQLGLSSVVIDVGETNGSVVASARAEMHSAESLQKARSIVDGVRTMASLSDDPNARTLLDAVTVSSSGLTLEIRVQLPVAEVARLIQSHHRD